MKEFFKRIVLSLFSTILVFSSSVSANSITDLCKCEDIVDIKIEVLKIANDRECSEIERQLSLVLGKVVEYIVDKRQLFWMLENSAFDIVKFYIEILDACSSSQEDWKSEINKCIHDNRTDLELYQLAALANAMKLEGFSKNMGVPVRNQGYVRFEDFNNVIVHYIHDKLSNKPNSQSSDNIKMKIILEEKSIMLNPLKYDLKHLNSVCSENFIAKLLSPEDRENIVLRENFRFPFMIANYPKKLQPLFEYVISKNIKNTPQALDLAIQLFNGLNTLHRKGVFYGGISPFNILVDEDGKLKLSNFNNSIMSDAVNGDVVRSSNLIVLDIRKAQEFISKFLISSESEIGIKYEKLLSAKSESVLRKICSAKAHLEILRSLKI